MPIRIIPGGNYFTFANQIVFKPKSDTAGVGDTNGTFFFEESGTILLVADFSDTGDGYNAPAMIVNETVIPPLLVTADFSDDDFYTGSAMIVDETVIPPLLVTADFSDVGDGYAAPLMDIVPAIDLNISVAFSEDSTMTVTETVIPPILLTGDFSDTGDGYNAPRMFVEPDIFRDTGHLQCFFDDDGSQMGMTETVDFPPLPTIVSFIVMG